MQVLSGSREGLVSMRTCRDLVFPCLALCYSSSHFPNLWHSLISYSSLDQKFYFAVHKIIQADCEDLGSQAGGQGMRFHKGSPVTLRHMLYEPHFEKYCFRGILPMPGSAHHTTSSSWSLAFVRKCLYTLILPSSSISVVVCHVSYQHLILCSRTA